MNLAHLHSAGHQNARGTVIGDGYYESSFSFEKWCAWWVNLVEANAMRNEKELRERESRLNQQSTSDAVLALHREHMNHFFQEINGASYYRSHMTCFCCLKTVPEHPLYCGHVLCTACIHAYGGSYDNYVAMEACPLHWQVLFPEPWRVARKPEHAGLRLLCLDG